jgi:hypothetical protein
MAYPTNIFWRFSSPFAGIHGPVTIAQSQGATNGAQPVNTVTQQAGNSTQETRLGATATFIDDTYGEIEAVYMKGVASTIAGSAVLYDPRNSVTSLLITTSKTTEYSLIAIALQPSVASQYGWYAIRGVVPVSTTGTTINKGLAASATAGQLTVISTGTSPLNGDILGMSTQAADGTSGGNTGTGFTDCMLSYPSVYMHS